MIFTSFPVAEQAITSAQVDQAVGMQASLRSQKLGDILLNQQVVTPDQLVVALEQQSRTEHTAE